LAYVDDENDPRRDRNLAQIQAPMAAPEGAPAASGGAPVGGGAPVAPAGGAAPAAAGGAHGTGFINLSSYIGANQGGAQGMANAIGGDVSQLGAATMADANKLEHEGKTSLMPTFAQVDPTLQAKLGPEAAQASMAAQALQSPGGIGALMTNHYGQQGGYGSGMRGFDSFLAGNAGGDQFQQLGNQYGGLDKYVAGIGASYKPIVAGSGPGTGGGMAKPPAPASPPPPPPASTGSEAYMGLGSGYGSPGWSPGAVNAEMPRTQPPPAPPPTPGQGLMGTGPRKKRPLDAGGGR
jgi:hypothetical protein